jgi:hypothetical protein
VTRTGTSDDRPEERADGEPGERLTGMRSLRRRLVGDGPARVGGPADLGYGMGSAPGPFDQPPLEPVELDDDELPWELQGR